RDALRGGARGRGAVARRSDPSPSVGGSSAGGGSGAGVSAGGGSGATAHGAGRAGVGGLDVVWLDDEAPAVDRPPVSVIERPARVPVEAPAPRPTAGPGRAENQYTLIYGKKGQGKTIALRKIVA